MIKSNNKQTNQILAIFDSLEYIKKHNDFSYLGNDYNIDDIKKAQAFLLAYQGSLGTFNAYRREIERLLQWCALVVRKSLNDLRREDIEDYIKFCQKPPKKWIGTYKPARFVTQDNQRVPNPKWKPFIVTISKSEHRRGIVPDSKNFELSQDTIKEIFAVIGSFYSYLQQ